ncbi:MAG: hypothetical protein EU532_08430, partial [Promethearchaeota archaeon]
EGIATIAAGVWKQLPDGSIGPCVVRLSDFKTNEYQNLIGGWIYEGDENNPMMGFRGASRYVSDDFQNAFILELRAIAKAREWGLVNIIPMIPFCRTPEEAKKIEEIMKSEGLVRGKDGLKMYVMAEIPSNIICADIFCQYFDGFSIGSNDLTQLVYGSSRDEAKLISLSKEFNYITNSKAIRRSVKHLIKVAHENGKKVGICGQAPSDDPDFLRFLVRESIDSLSLNFDTYASGRINTWRTEIIEAKLKDDAKDKSYQFLQECDEVIEKIRIPRGKLRNMVRKQRGKAIDSKLEDASLQFDTIFNEIQTVSYDFIKELHEQDTTNFNTIYEKYNSRIKEFGSKIPNIKKDVREFGIY